MKFPSTKYSELKEEQAEIVSMTYVPERSDTTVGMGPSFGGNGGMAITIGSVSFPEVWAVGFRCEGHNKTFVLQGKELFNHAKIGEKVILKYVDEIQYYKDIPNSELIKDHHTKQIIFNSGKVNR